jgi:hypothetical protein
VEILEQKRSISADALSRVGLVVRRAVGGSVDSAVLSKKVSHDRKERKGENEEKFREKQVD